MSTGGTSPPNDRWSTCHIDELTPAQSCWLLRARDSLSCRIDFHRVGIGKAKRPARGRQVFLGFSAQLGRRSDRQLTIREGQFRYGLHPLALCAGRRGAQVPSREWRLAIALHRGNGGRRPNGGDRTSRRQRARSRATRCENGPAQSSTSPFDSKSRQRRFAGRSNCRTDRRRRSKSEIWRFRCP